MLSKPGKDIHQIYQLKYDSESESENENDVTEDTLTNNTFNTVPYFLMKLFLFNKNYS